MKFCLNTSTIKPQPLVRKIELAGQQRRQDNRDRHHLLSRLDSAGRAHAEGLRIEVKRIAFPALFELRSEADLAGDLLEAVADAPLRFLATEVMGNIDRYRSGHYLFRAWRFGSRLEMGLAAPVRNRRQRLTAKPRRSGPSSRPRPTAACAEDGRDWPTPVRRSAWSGAEAFSP